MCGIVGIYGFEDKSLIRKMADIMGYRGPDQEGFYFDKNICLGHKRLSIIDLSAKGRQPIFNDDKSLVIVYNGEVFNFQEIRKELEKKGCHFNSNTDSEVVLKAYEQYGVKCLEKFNGFFAFAIWDSRKKIVFLARDRLGVKPLYYTKNKDYFIFASELKSILLYEEFQKKINWPAVDSFLTLRYIPGNLTAVQEIYKLEPGYYAILDTKKNNLDVKKYWNLDYSDNGLDLNDNMKILDTLMDDAVKKRMISDVPLGAFMGGGIDSTAIIKYMSKYADKPIETFTLGFEKADDVNEYDYAKLVSDYFNTNHHEIEMKAADITLLPKAIWHLDEPMADPNSVPLYILTKEARKKVTVVLTGEGGDEIFGGYEQYKIMQKLDSYTKKLPEKLIAKTASLASGFMPSTSIFNKLLTFASTIDNKSKSYVELLAIFNSIEKNGLYTDKTKSEINQNYTEIIFDKYFNNNHALLNKMLLADTKTLLPENLLMNLDKMGMANSMEGRTPFLDYRVVEFAATIKPELKLNGFNEKYILKKTMEGKVPKIITDRKKHRFHVPIDTWYNLYLKDFSENLLSEKEILKYGHFNANYIKKLLNYQKSFSYRAVLKHNELTRLYYARQLWNILVFDIWRRMFIDGDVGKPNLDMGRLL